MAPHHWRHGEGRLWLRFEALKRPIEALGEGLIQEDLDADLPEPSPEHEARPGSGVRGPLPQDADGGERTADGRRCALDLFQAKVLQHLVEDPPSRATKPTLPGAPESAVFQSRLKHHCRRHALPPVLSS